ncbi:MAG: tlde1 domain-containing protein [Xanthobacteraceae bacterium]
MAAPRFGVPAYDQCRASAGGDYRRAIRRAGFGIGTLTAASGTAGAVTLTAAWMIAAAISSAPHAPGLPSHQDKIALRAPSGGLAARMIADFDAVAGAAAGLSRASPSPEAEHAKSARLDAPFRRVPFPRARFAAVHADEGAREEAMLKSLAPAGNIGASPEAAASLPSGYVAAAFDLFDPQPTLAAGLVAMPRLVAQHPQAARVAAQTNEAPASARQPESARVSAPLELAYADAGSGLPPVANAASAPPQHSALTGFLHKLFGQRLASANPDVAPLGGGHTAIYDIEARTVYMPNGERLEAHSGLGALMDDPRYASRKDRGPTPPNVYDLVLREGSFHGVQAIRLKPENDDKMFGRAGILAHPYMLGGSGQSFGCVSFKDYPAFLKAFENGEVNRLVVVPSRGDYPRYAAND